MNQAQLVAPLSGWALPLSEVPDPVFSQGLAGQGWAIDPTEGVLVAPCDGEITLIHRCKHAMTLRHPEGVEILMHVGIDTVKLEGAGLQPQVSVGQQVKAGQVLMTFDCELLASQASSLVTVILVPEHPKLQAVQASGGMHKRGQPWMNLSLRHDGAGESDRSPDTLNSGQWLELPNPSGMHARPAAKLIQLCKALPGRIFLEGAQGQASARSLTGLLGLGLGRGSEVRLLYDQLHASQVQELEQAILQGLGDDLKAPVPSQTSVVPVAASAGKGQLAGVMAAPGIAIGTVLAWARPTFVIPENLDVVVADQLLQWQRAQSQATSEIESLKKKAPLHEKGIFEAHQEILQDPELALEVTQAIEANQSAARAWHQTYDGHARRLEGLSNPVLAARASDLRDVGERLLGCLLGQQAAQRDFPEQSIVVAKDLTPSDTLQLQAGKVVGLALAAGGATSHVAILSRSLGIPSLCALGAELLQLRDGTRVLLDAEQNLLTVDPSAEQLQEASVRIQEALQRRQLEAQSAHQPATTKDGTVVEVAVNVGGTLDLDHGLSNGAEGVGLFRTEFYFHEQPQMPSLEQQVEHYRSLALKLGQDKRLVARLLDVGGDKPLDYLAMNLEENPFLGVRGIRLFRKHPELFRTQISALLRCSQDCRLALMAPMVSSLSEWRALKKEILALAGDRTVELGIMIEVPSAALLAEQFASEVDFFSIGTNDLTQYTLAIDRGHPDLAGEVDALHPAVIELMQLVGQAAAKHGKWVGVCGGAAQDLEAVPILLGLNVRELSVSASAIASVKSEVRRWSIQQCQKLAQQARELGQAQDVRQLVKENRS